MRLLELDPAPRMTATEALQHPWLAPPEPLLPAPTARTFTTPTIITAATTPTLSSPQTSSPSRPILVSPRAPSSGLENTLALPHSPRLSSLSPPASPRTLTPGLLELPPALMTSLSRLTSQDCLRIKKTKKT